MIWLKIKPIYVTQVLIGTYKILKKIKTIVNLQIIIDITVINKSETFIHITLEYNKIGALW